jgi:hypothetical protein
MDTFLDGHIALERAALIEKAALALLQGYAANGNYHQNFHKDIWVQAVQFVDARPTYKS